MEYYLSTTTTFALIMLAIWELVWKGLALWKAGRNNQAGWFIALLLINSAGILPIIYLLTHRNINHFDEEEIHNEKAISVER